METTFTPSLGQVVLVEYADGTDGCMTGLVLDSYDRPCRIDLGASGPLREDAAGVVVSVFAPDALYRVRATARATEPAGVIALDPIEDVERVQRRSAPRLAVRLGAALVADGAEPVAGRTLDVGRGGVRLETLRPIDAKEVSVTVTLPDGRLVRGKGHVLDLTVDGDSHEYRVAFTELDPDGASALEALVGGTSGGPRVAQPA